MLAKLNFYPKLILAFVSIAALCLLAGANLSAQSDSDTATANTMKISPLRTDISANPGETKTVQITITNPSKFDISVRPIQNDFLAGDEEGTPALILEENEFAPSHSLKRFLQPLESTIIPAGEAKTVDVVIAVPADAEPGGYFGAVRFAPTSPDDGGQVNMSISAASLILLTVNGDAPEKLNLTDFVVKQGGRVGSFFTGSDNIEVMARFQNKGNVQAGPFGKLSVTKGDEVVYQEDFNNKSPRDVILPDSARRWSIPVSDLTGFGKYTVKAIFTYGSKNQTVEAVTSFWVVPLPILLGAVAVLLVIIAAIVGIVLKSRRKDQGMSL